MTAAIELALQGKLDSGDVKLQIHTSSVGKGVLGADS
jgi:hypothetical protein